MIDQYFAKGHPILVEGRLKVGQWQDKESGDRCKLKVVVESFEFIVPRSNGDEKPPAASPNNEGRPQSGSQIRRPQVAGARR